MLNERHKDIPMDGPFLDVVFVMINVQRIVAPFLTSKFIYGFKL